jgi:hypothetical protein
MIFDGDSEWPWRIWYSLVRRKRMPLAASRIEF